MSKKNIIYVLSIIIISVITMGTGVLAQETELPDPGLTPDSPFYFLEIIVEEIGTFLTFGELKKAERYALLAAERLAEIQAVIEKERPEFVEKTLERYEMQLEKSMAWTEKAQSKSKNTEKVMEAITKVGKATSVHLEVLAEVYEKVPEQAKPAIENAMKVSVKGHEKAVEALKAQNALGEVPEEVFLPSQVPQEVRERIQIRVQQELEVEKVLEGLDSSKSLRDICAEHGGTPEMCEEFPLEKFESFEQVEAFCTEKGGPSEICTSLEAKCREFGVTTANECFLLLSISTIKTYQSATIESSVAPVLSEEEIEERRRMEERRRIELQTEEETIETPAEHLECKFNEMIFYYFDVCTPCQKVKDEGTIEKIEGLGVKVNQVNTNFGPTDHQIQMVPTFVINEKIYSGYKTFEELKKLLECQ